jgi:hypothetical protein
MPFSGLRMSERFFLNKNSLNSLYCPSTVLAAQPGSKAMEMEISSTRKLTSLSPIVDYTSPRLIHPTDAHIRRHP